MRTTSIPFCWSMPASKSAWVVFPQLSKPSNITRAPRSPKEAIVPKGALATGRRLVASARGTFILKASIPESIIIYFTKELSTTEMKSGFLVYSLQIMHITYYCTVLLRSTSGQVPSEQHVSTKEPMMIHPTRGK